MSSLRRALARAVSKAFAATSSSLNLNNLRLEEILSLSPLCSTAKLQLARTNIHNILHIAEYFVARIVQFRLIENDMLTMTRILSRQHYASDLEQYH